MQESSVLPLNFSTFLGSVDDDVLGFSVPYYNGIYQYSAELAVLGKLPIYYGDTMTLKDWKFLHIKFGKSPEDNILTLQKGYLYKYYYSSKKFKVYDDTGKLILLRTNVETIGDLHIDFTIYKNHQFEIIIDIDDFSILPFFVPVVTHSEIYGESPVSNIYTGTIKDSVTDVKSSYDEFPFYVYRGEIQKDYKYVDQDIQSVILSIYKLFDFGYLNSSVEFSAINMNQSSQVYGSGYDVIEATVVPKDFTFNQIFFTWLLSNLSNTLYPVLFPILRPGETSNNRPVYEPWLIWKFLLLSTYADNGNDDNDIIIPVFDLSPNWNS